MWPCESATPSRPAPVMGHWSAALQSLTKQHEDFWTRVSMKKILPSYRNFDMNLFYALECRHSRTLSGIVCMDSSKLRHPTSGSRQRGPTPNAKAAPEAASDALLTACSSSRSSSREHTLPPTTHSCPPPFTMAYVAPVHLPTSIRHAIRLQFSSPDHDDLIVAYVSIFPVQASSGPALAVYPWLHC